MTLEKLEKVFLVNTHHNWCKEKLLQACHYLYWNQLYDNEFWEDIIETDNFTQKEFRLH